MMRILVPIVCGHVHANCGEHVGSLGSGKCHFLWPLFSGRKFLLSVPCPMAEGGNQEPVLGDFMFFTPLGIIRTKKHQCNGDLAV